MGGLQLISTFPDGLCKDMSAQIKKHLAESQLSSAFEGTQGMSFAFTEEGLEFLVNEFGFFKHFLDKALDLSKFNAFYLNALLVENGGRVDLHVDCSLNGWLEKFQHADNVTILYLEVPGEGLGGELNLYDDEGEVLTFEPFEGGLISFDGNIAHSVNSFNSSQVRLSLVLESYSLPVNLFKKVPGFFSFA